MQSDISAPRGIKWYQWHRDAFELAEARGVPVLLSISASWCHWCHVLDSEAFSDPEVVSVINSDYVPIRVDTDVRPDVNAMYNMGGWPTVALLDHDGRILSGATYLPAPRMLEWLQRTSSTYPLRTVGREKPRPSRVAPRGLTDFTPNLKPRSDLLSWIEDAYDETYGGFGTEPKFPMFDCLALIASEYDATGEARWRNMLLSTLASMTGGGTYDRVEGGLFRYSTTRDWSVPHFEKMLLDNALLLSICGQAYRATSEPWLVSVAENTVSYMNNTLFMDIPGVFAGSQDADDTYYRLQTPELRARSASPRIDRRVYSDWNSIAGGALITCGAAMDKPAWVQHGLAVLRNIHDLCFDPVHGMGHVWEGEPGIWGLAHDLIAHGAACLHAFDATDEPMWKERSLLLASRIVSTHGNQGLVSRLPTPDDPPGFERPVRDFHENAYGAMWLTRAAQLADSPHDAAALRSSALECLAVCHRLYPRYGIHGAAYGLALERYLDAHATAAESGLPHGIQCEGGVCRPGDRPAYDHGP
ncbi:MAG: thioredoxin domain-containing protein [Firmicutes bacterium]|nr:thioredoxin domain-containing protein [Bacillota bacterium]